jgi:hypothetical protein
LRKGTPRYRLVEKSNGQLDIEGSADGTTVEIRLPRVQERPDPSAEAGPGRDGKRQDVTAETPGSDVADGAGISEEGDPLRHHDGDDANAGSDAGRTEIADK